MLVISALPAQSLGEPEAWLAALVAWRLTVAAADVAQAVAKIETGIATPGAGSPAFDAAGAAGAARGEYLRVKFALKTVADAARCGLLGIRGTAAAAVLGAAGEAAMRLPVARARVAHRTNVPGIGRVKLSVSHPFRRACFRAVATHLSGIAAG